MAKYSPYSTCVTYLQIFVDETKVGEATGFYIRHGEIDYLVTNWHVLAGLDPITNKLRSKRPPNKIKCILHLKGKPSLSFVFASIDIVDSNNEILWLEHEKLGQKIDVAVLPIKPIENRFPEPLNKLQDFPPEFIEPMVGSDVFVLGYPFGEFIFKKSPFPIYKRASIATELSINIDSLPMFLIDTATREGMSGSPVIYMKGEFMEILGVYSGRYGNDDLEKIQLGRVFRGECINQIISNGISGLSNYRGTR